MQKIVVSVFSFLAILNFSVFGYSQGRPASLHKLIVFHSLNCRKCIEAKKGLLPEIEKEFQDRILLEYRDIADIQNYKLLLSLQEKYKAQDLKFVLPIFYFQGHFLNGEGQPKEGLKRLIEQALSKPKEKLDLPQIDLLTRFKTFRPFAIISAGLIDGINPCAFSVIVFFISFLTLQGYRKRELVVVGLSFIFSVALTYILIGMGLFGFLYRLKGFWLVSRIVNLSIGILSILLGVFALYDFFKFKRTKNTDGLLLQLPQAVKNRIHAVIGLYYRSQRKDEGGILRKNIFSLVSSALITGFLVSILEAVCTGQVYLPTIAFVLKTTPLKLQALGYLLLYNLMFIIPLLLIFLCALLGVSSEQFSGALKRHLLAAKILMAVLFFSLGAFLILRA